MMGLEMKVIKEELRFEENLKKILEFICEFSNVTPTFVNGNIRKIEKTNISYVEPHRVIVKDVMGNLLKDAQQLLLVISRF